MKTINQVAKAAVEECINHDYITECGGSLKAVYMAEYGNWNGFTPNACKDYLQGLPSVCTVPFWNDEILELLAKESITRKTDDAQAKLIDDYWYACGNALYMLINNEGK